MWSIKNHNGMLYLGYDMYKTFKKIDLFHVLADIQFLFNEKMFDHDNQPIYNLHELLGVMHEEFDEFADEVRDNNSAKAREELLDIAVAAIWGIASIDGKIS